MRMYEVPPPPLPFLPQVTAEPCEHGGTDAASRVSQSTKRDQHGLVDESPKKKKRQKSSGKPPGKAPSAKKAKVTPKKKTPKKKTVAPATPTADPAPAAAADADADLPTPPLSAQASTPVNAHRAKILVAKQALAAIKAGTRKCCAMFLLVLKTALCLTPSCCGHFRCFDDDDYLPGKVWIMK